MDLAGTKTAENLQAAFTAESLAATRYLYFAQKAETEGRAAVAKVFRATAETCMSQAHGHLEYLELLGDPVTGQAIGETAKNLAAAQAEQRDAETISYADMAGVAQNEGLEELVDWFRRLDETRQQRLRVLTEAADENAAEEE